MMSNLKRYKAYKLLEFALFALPIIILIAVNYEKYITKVEVKFSVYFYLALILVVVAFKDKAMNLAKKNSALSLSIIIFFTSVIMKSMATELLWLSLAGILGSALSSIISPITKVYFFECFEITVNGERKRIFNEPISNKTAWRKAYK